MPKVVTISAVSAAVLILFAVLFLTGNPEPATKDAELKPSNESAQAATTPRGVEFSDSQSIAAPPAPQVSRKAKEPSSAPPVNSALKTDDKKFAVQSESLEKIENAVITYSPEAVKNITPMLSSADPEIRDAAIEGLVQLGEKRGADALRRAARTAKTPEERARMIEAAEFIELPPVQLEWVNPSEATQANR